MEQLFAPPGEPWQRVDPRLGALRAVRLGFAVAVAVVVGCVVLAVVGQAVYAVAVVVAGLLVAAGGSALLARNARSWGYAERADDLFITRGFMLRRLVVVPYGRMQFVDVTAGPLERAFGLATVQLHTATPGTAASIPGLRAEEAARLRDRLTALGEVKAAGL